jgi:uncharacterized membrane protein
MDTESTSRDDLGMNPPQTAQPSAAAATKDDTSIARIVYVLYLVAVGTKGITAVIGVIMAYLNEAQAPEWVKTHYRLQIRTFWILILYCAAAFPVYVRVIRLPVLPLTVLQFLVAPAIVVWLVIRCVKGLHALANRKPYAKPASWLW